MVPLETLEKSQPANTGGVSTLQFEGYTKRDSVGSAPGSKSATELVMSNPYDHSKPEPAARHVEHQPVPQHASHHDSSNDKAVHAHKPTHGDDHSPLITDRQGQYQVKHGDALSTIASRALHGQGIEHPTASQIHEMQKGIIQANQKEHPELKDNPNLIREGAKLMVPGSKSEVSEGHSPQPHGDGKHAEQTGKPLGRPADSQSGDLGYHIVLNPNAHSGDAHLPVAGGAAGDSQPIKLAQQGVRETATPASIDSSNPSPSSWQYDSAGHLLSAGNRFKATYDNAGKVATAELDGETWAKNSEGKIVNTYTGVNDGKMHKRIMEGEITAAPYHNQPGADFAGINVTAGTTDGHTSKSTLIYETPQHQKAAAEFWKRAEGVAI
jgi:hypothetical protein